MKVIFIDPTSMEGSVDESGSTRLLNPNMGLLSMATYLKAKAGASVLLLDAHNGGYRRLPALLKEYRPQLAAISAKTFNIQAAYHLARVIKETLPGTVVVAGGAHPSALPEYTLQECPHLDAVAAGEGEKTLLEIYQRLKEMKGDPQTLFDGIAGLVYRNREGQAVRNQPGTLLEDLDALPFPDYSLVDYKRYRRVYNPANHKFQHIYPVFGSRGCPFHCVFCMPLLTRKHRKRSVENILDEIEQLHKLYNIKRIYFEDSLFFAQKETFAGFCEQYNRRGFHKKIQWGFETRIDVADKEMFKLAEKSGCIYTFFGVESGSPRVLKRAKKNYSPETIIEKVTAAGEAGLKEVGISIIFGLPGETKESIGETIRLLETLPYNCGNINILDIYPGTELFRMVENNEEGLRWLDNKRMNWDAYSRNAPMTEVNDVTTDFLLDAWGSAKKITAAKSRVNKKELFLKRLAHTIEFAKTDRRRLIKKIGDTFKGLR